MTRAEARAAPAGGRIKFSQAQGPRHASRTPSAKPMPAAGEERTTNGQSRRKYLMARNPTRRPAGTQGGTR